MDDDDCPHCGGTGILDDTCVCNSVEDVCCCADPEPMDCPECLEREHMASLAAMQDYRDNGGVTLDELRAEIEPRH